MYIYEHTQFSPFFPGAVTFEGLSTDVWIIQVDSSLNIAANTNMVLAVGDDKSGAMAKNIFWAVGTSVTIGKGSHVEGIINAQTAVVLSTGASMNGRIFSGTASTLIQNAITEPM